MTRPLLLVAGGAFVATVLCLALVLVSGPVNWTDWRWDGPDFYRRGPPVPGDGPTVTRTLDWRGGDELRFSVPARVAYTQGPQARITVTGPQGTVEHLVMDDENLHLDRRVRSPGQVEVTITAPSVKEFSLLGWQRLTIAGYDQDRLEVRIGGAGEVTATGKARAVEAHIAGSGDIDLGGVAAEDAEVHIAGSGRTTLAPTGRAEIHIAGSGDVFLKTRPAHLEQHIAGSGRIVQAEEPAT